MDTQQFDELAGRIEGVARAVLILAQMMEEATDIDGLTLTSQWRESAGQQPKAGILGIAQKTLHELAQQLDDARSRRQESLAAALRADPNLLQAHLQRPGPVEHRHLDALNKRLTRAEHQIGHFQSTAPRHPPRPTEHRASSS